MPITLKTPRRTPQMSSLYFPCPRANYRTQLCFALCTPVGGMGECGRAAGHAHLGRTQLAILGSRRSVAPVRRPSTYGTSA